MNDPRVNEPKDGTEATDDSAAEGSSSAESSTESPAKSSIESSTESSTESSPESSAAPAAAYPAVVPAASAGRSFGIVLGFFALLVAFAAVGGVAFTWWQVTEQQEVVAEKTSEAARDLADIRALVLETQARVAAQDERFSELRSEAEARRRELESLDSEIDEARERMESFAREDFPEERSPAVAEVEYLLLLAARELALADNPRVALAALRKADAQLAALDDPSFAATRRAINEEIAAVEAVADVDLEGLALRLDSLAGRIEGLPLHGSLSPEPLADASAGTEETGWKRFLARLRAVTADLFRIRRTDTPAAPLLAPDESFFLYRNIELDLKSARLAVLARDQENFNAGVEAARAALREYFVVEDEAVRAMLDALDELGTRDVTPEWPSIGRSLELLRETGAAG
ncbi:uroporphyrinogen-III C-methyltransferase [Wenzhouxiangella sp. XN24]|uniref:uroporphyrinogen-III C-methyltransferase n=1 Tax=Wenzhouxiangella sp. XN24 TaxID=2713569 RepID=UPI0013EC65F9|nr:uroporphyrinogen-III C-methyltransferase [Wenzhouxiangella sp. XN24]NGX17358.1 hypothetical protein [Wenzhouxiangella sp. XN24]